MRETQYELSDIPKVLVNTKSGDIYERLRFFGKVTKNQLFYFSYIDCMHW